MAEDWLSLLGQPRYNALANVLYPALSVRLILQYPARVFKTVFSLIGHQALHIS